MLQVGAWREAEIAHADVGFVEMRVGILDGLGAALLAACANARLDTDCAGVLRGLGLSLRLDRRRCLVLRKFGARHGTGFEGYKFAGNGVRTGALRNRNN